MYCKNCNKMIPDGTTFCPYCGTPQQVQQNEPVGYQQDDSATVLVQDGNMGYPNGGFQPPVNAPYQQPVNPGYQAPVTPDYHQQGQNAGFQPQMPPVNPAFQQPAPQKKSKTGLIIGLVVGGLVLVGIIVGVLIAIFSASDSYSESYNDSVISDDFLDDSYDDVFDDSNDDTNDEQNNDVNDNQTDLSAEFQQILDDNELTFSCYDFGDFDYSVYAMERDNGMIDIQEIASDGDTIKEMYETICLPTTGYTQAQLDDLDKDMREAYAGYEELYCCLVDYYQIEDFYVIELYVWNLDDADNIRDLAELGFVQNGYATVLSLNMTRTSLLNSGYVEG